MSSSHRNSILSRLSFIPSPEHNIYDHHTKHLNLEHDDQSVQSNFPKKFPGKENLAKRVFAKQKPDQECDNSKLKVAKSKPSKEVKAMVSEEGKQDLKSVQPKKKPAKKEMAKHRCNKEVKEAVSEEGIKAVKGKEKMGNKAVVNSKPDEECDNNELATSNNTVNTAPEMSSLDTETPPTAQSSPKEQSVLELGDDDVPIQSLCPCPFDCGIEPCKITLMKHYIIVNHSSSEPDKTDCDAITTVEEDNIVRRTFMLSQKSLLMCYKFSKLMQENNFHEVVLPGNGYCYISVILITLAEQGVNKEMAILAHKVMTEIQNHIRFCRTFHDSSSEEEFLTSCSDYFQRVSYSTRVVDVCIGARANALGVNLNVVQKNQRTVLLTRYDCNHYKSSMNLFLLFIPPSKKRKNLDGHYNCYVNQDYFKQNEAAINSYIVKPIEEIQPQVLGQDAV